MFTRETFDCLDSDIPFRIVPTKWLWCLFVILIPFELRMRFIGTTLPHKIEMGHSSLNPSGEHDWHVRLRARVGFEPRADSTAHLTGALDHSTKPFIYMIVINIHGLHLIHDHSNSKIHPYQYIVELVSKLSRLSHLHP